MSEKPLHGIMKSFIFLLPVIFYACNSKNVTLSQLKKVENQLEGLREVAMAENRIPQKYGG